MEYLVTMTTHVPDGTSEGAVQGIRTREAAHSGQLATQGHLLRLWRPPLQPGEWRTLGLFAADDGVELEEVLASRCRCGCGAPMRSLHSRLTRMTRPDRSKIPEGPGPNPATSEFLTTFTVAVPADTDPETVDATTRSEADRARELAGQGYLERLWTLPGEGRTLGLWQAPDSAGMSAILASLPLSPWMSVQTTPLTRHPSDPALASG